MFCNNNIQSYTSQAQLPARRKPCNIQPIFKQMFGGVFLLLDKLDNPIMQSFEYAIAKTKLALR